ncbi:hypothetical protein AN957_14790 [Cytobacillus solani]|uniref:Uncharacterized protein n=1 Tax=Cytobacillus solani TaxID=1637975 RepID=A0A0Q3VI28_9BACI|nr:hypothetical protein AMS60_09525 [Bacillus sp. FJAT-21945]KQL19711.1 hypothetical protein AN957_14790 [Cytobacillus solani]
MSVQVQTGSREKSLVESEVSPSSDRIKRKKPDRVRSQSKFRQEQEKIAPSSPKSAQVQTELIEKSPMKSKV